ncbi:MAG: bifunctional [glutamate--ammonia ligase]-adenylyl-L-tyrosine phosphorylase/[glutamate--ammonia-ligase] adenylyltransferase [Planctomycetota bacterium]|nr:MAG: bifunctional [glutamate--ammonia ligase]-adenylyl-L-tyrosine phosphorylase/[glutamate--ammonia-ligase] adenylyltransferase [Planctomycetota bacterium]
MAAAPRLSPRQQLELEYGDPAVSVLARVDTMAASFTDPDDIVRAVRRFITNDGRIATELRSLGHDPIALECLVRLAGCSRFGLGIAIFEYGQFWAVVQDRLFRQVWGRQSMREEWGHFRANQYSLEGRINALLAFQHRHLLRIILGDLMGDLTLPAITAEIADLADVCIQAAVDLAEEATMARWGQPPARLTVFAMGKLGARELNYSSDIDLIFSYTIQEERQQDDIGAHEYCCRWGQEIIRILDTTHSRGRLYRVDMRLRPEGASGELALANSEIHDYCYSVGRSWERQAWIKARAVAGDLAAGQALIQELQPWIFPIDPRWEELKDAAVMRQRIEERCSDEDVKIGAGGIRDIEFLVQYYQLGWGGRIPELRQRSTLDVMDALQRHGLMTREHHEQLASDYEWLRMVEHRLQMWESRQVHALPDQDEQRRHVADRCGYQGPDGLQRFDADLNDLRLRVRALAEEHYLGIDDERAAAFALIHMQDPPASVRERLLSSVGFRDPDRAIQLIRSLAHEPFFLLRRSRTEHALAELLPDLLLDLGRSPNPDRALQNFVRIVDSVGGRALFYEQMIRQGDARRRLTNLAGWADALVEQMVRHPGLADEVVERLHRGVASLPEMIAELRDQVHGEKHDYLITTVQFLQTRELVATAIEDLEGVMPAVISRHLSAVAQAIIQILYEWHVDHMAQRWGMPRLANGEPDRFAIIGLGKSGSGEMSYASDLDVCFVHDGASHCPDGDHQGDQFWQRVAQGIMRDCQEARLYEIDARLRPWGDQGALVVSRATIERYWRQPRELWERLAHTRISPMAGDESLGTMIVKHIADAVIHTPLAPDAVTQVVTMRHRLQHSVEQRDHVKRGPGGYVDVEFLVQFGLMGGLQLGHMLPVPEAPRSAVEGLSWRARELVPPVLAELHDGDHELGELPVGQPIASALVGLQQAGLIAPQAAADMLVGLTLLRWVESRMRLYAGKAISHLPTDIQARTSFARCAGYQSLADMDQDLHLVRERCRFWFDYYICEGLPADHAQG